MHAWCFTLGRHGYFSACCSRRELTRRTPGSGSKSFAARMSRSRSAPMSALGWRSRSLDQAIPSGGLSGTLLIVRGLGRRGVPRGGIMAAVVIDLVSYYATYGLALGAAFGVIGAYGDTATLLWVSRGRRLPGWLERLPLLSPALRALEEATPGIAHNGSLIAQCASLQLAIVAFDAGTLWAMLWALGVAVNPMPVFASFMLSTLRSHAWRGAWSARGLRSDIRGNTKTHRGAARRLTRRNTSFSRL